jgi:hypothetical protein
MLIINPPATAGGTDSDPGMIRDFRGKTPAVKICGATSKGTVLA